MTRNWKRALIGVAVAAVIAGLVVVITSGGSTSSDNTHSHAIAADASSPAAQRSTDVAVAASYLGVSRAAVRRGLRDGHTLSELAASTKGHSSEGLIAALVHARAARIEALAASGQLSKQKEQASLATLPSLETARARQAYRSARRSAKAITVASRYLGVSVTKLRAAQASGHSLAQIAQKTPGRSRMGLIDALVTANKRTLRLAVAQGRISHETAKRVEPRLTELATLRVDRVPVERAPNATKP